MKEFLIKVLKKFRFWYQYTRSGVMGLIHRKKFRDVKGFILFVGYPRSGHSIVGALLDAHPNIIIGMEWNVLAHLKAGYRKNQIFYSLMLRSKIFREKEKNVWTGYSYRIEDSYQGRFTTIRFFGDKLGGFVSRYLVSDPDLFPLLRKEVGVPVYHIHVIRNPFDVISTMTNRYYEKIRPPDYRVTHLDLLNSVERFFRWAYAILDYRQNNDLLWIDIYHEEMIRDSHAVLRKLMDFFGLEAGEGYYRSCQELIYRSPHKSRSTVPWTPELIRFVEEEIKKIPFLARYSFDD